MSSRDVRHLAAWGWRMMLGFMARAVAVAVLLALAVAACDVLPGPAIVVFHNRSAVAIALLPGMAVAPCSTAEFDQDDLDAGNARWQEDPLQSWIPEGAIEYGGISGGTVGSTEPITVIVSGVTMPREVEGRVSSAALPPCGGAPLGVQ